MFLQLLQCNAGVGTGENDLNGHFRLLLVLGTPAAHIRASQRRHLNVRDVEVQCSSKFLPQRNYRP